LGFLEKLNRRLQAGVKIAGGLETGGAQFADVGQRLFHIAGSLGGVANGEREPANVRIRGGGGGGVRINPEPQQQK